MKSTTETKGDAESEKKVAIETSDEQTGMEEEAETPEQEIFDEKKEGAAVGAEVADVVEVDVELEDSEKEQPMERDVDSVLLSEKERQNEEVNEKDNCSASSISSTSSTLEREEREEKLSNDSEGGTAHSHFLYTHLYIYFSKNVVLCQQASGPSALKKM